MAKLVIFEGPDGSGKTTLIEKMKKMSNVRLLDFPKRNPAGFRLDIKSRAEVSCFETMLKYLDDRFIYLLDRSYFSNYVYEKWRDPKNPLLLLYLVDINRLLATNEVKVVGLTRKIHEDYKDDLIDLTKEEFEKIIDYYDEVYSKFGIESTEYLKYGPNGPVPNLEFENSLYDYLDFS